jgi:hypothetical protein
MIDPIYLVRFKSQWLKTECVMAASLEIHGDPMALLTSKGELAALFVKDVVKSWIRLPGECSLGKDEIV